MPHGEKKCCIGPTGPAGSPGTIGPQGFTGPTGSAGIPGLIGPTGAAGAVGPKGCPGQMGPQGPQGIAGPPGPQGVVGAQGLQGVQGLQGLPGPQGVEGPQGLPGPIGPVGPPGPAGSGGLNGFEILNKNDSVISLDVTSTFFNNAKSFNLGFKTTTTYSADLPVYTLDNPAPPPGQTIVKNLSLLNPKSGNVKIKTKLGSFNLNFDDQDAKLMFVDNHWINFDDQPWYVDEQQGQKLVGSESTFDTRQGISVSLSADGNTLAVGGPGDKNNVGATWVFTRTGEVWTQQGSKLVGLNFSGNPAQGTSVSLSADGDTLAVGGPDDNGSAGATWIFTRSGGIWTQQGPKLVGSGAIGNAAQGQSVSLSGDGNTLAVGGPRNLTDLGSIWIFTRTASVWNQQGLSLIGSGDVFPSKQGASVSLSADGNTLAFGGWADDNQKGAVWIFNRDIYEIWSQQGPKLIGSNSSADANQGKSVSLSADGNIVAFGGPQNNTIDGAVWIFVRIFNEWTEEQRIFSPPDTVTYNQGSSVSLSADGTTLAVGANSSVSNTDPGATYIFTRSGGKWTQQGSQLVGTNSSINAKQGISVSLSAEGNTLAVGGFFDDNLTGATWIFK